MKTLSAIAFVLLALFSAAFVAAEQYGLTGSVYYRAHLESLGALAALAIGLLLTADLFLPVPSSILMTLAGYLSGFPAGLVANFLGAMGSALLGFWLCRRFGRKAFQRLIGDEQIPDVERFFDRYGVWAILLSRSIPMLTEIVSCLAGLSRMPGARFTLLSAAGTLPVAALYAWVGWRSGMADAVWWALLVALALPALGFALLRYWKRPRVVEAPEARQP